MSELITDAMVEAGAKAMWDAYHRGEPYPDDLMPEMTDARVALEAAAPAIAAKALRGAARDWQQGAWANVLTPPTSNPIANSQRVTHYIHARADRIEAKP